MFLTLPTVVFVAIHPNPGGHFNALGQVLDEHSIPFIAYGADQAFVRMGDLHPINISENLPLSQLDAHDLQQKAESLSDRISKEASFVLIDVGAPFSLQLTKALKERDVKVIAYVDNPDRFVPGYSPLAQRIEEAAGDIFYASSLLSEEKGIGYYPLDDIEPTRLLKNDAEKKNVYFEKQGLTPGKPLLVFMGGANTVFVDALKSFVDLNQGALEGWNLLLHRHPRAKEERLIDETLWQTLGGKTSTGTQNEAFAFADAIVYYQTTTALKGILLGIPTLEWGGLEDGLVRSGAVNMATTKDELRAFLQELPTPEADKGLKSVGYREDWKTRWLKLACS